MYASIEVSVVQKKLYEIHAEAILIMEESSATGKVDRSNTEGIFEAMREVASLGLDANFVNEDLRDLFNLCKLTSDIESLSDVEDLNGSTGLPREYEELPIAIIESCAALRVVNDAIKGVEFLANATALMDSDYRNNFLSKLAELMEEFDLLGEDSVTAIFNPNNQINS